jgi:hypothetical protein
VSVPPADRRAFPAERPAERPAPISPSHAAFVARLAGLVRQGGAVLDASCGPGKYWPALLAAGLHVTGVPLQDLPELPDRFDGLLCVDALENLTPEDWPGALAGLAAVLKDQAPAYLTVELPDRGGDHHYPPRDQVRRWLVTAGFAVTDEADADRYWHLLLARTTDR